MTARALLLGLLVLASPSLRAQEAPVATPLDLAERVPASTHFYVAFPSLGQAWEGFQSLPLYQAWRDEEVQAFMQTLGEGLEEPFPGVRWEFIEQLLDLPALFDGEAAFALVSPEDDDWILSLASGAAPGDDRLTRFTDALGSVLLGLFGDEATGEEIAGARVRRFTGPFGDCCLASRDTTIWISPHRERLTSVLEHAIAPAESLAHDPSYRKSVAGTVTGLTSFLLYVPLARLRDELLAKNEGRDLGPLQAAGLETVQGLVAALEMDAGRARDTVRLQAEGTRHGLLDLVGPGPIDTDVARLAPKNTVLLFAGELRLQALYETILSMARADRSGLFGGMRHPDEEIARQIGIRSLSELISSLGSQVIAFAALPRGGFIPKALLAIEVLRPDELQSDLLAIARTAAGQEAKTVPYRSREIAYIPTGSRMAGEISPCWCVTDGYLLVSHHPTIIKEAIARIDRGDGLDRDAEFTAAWKALPPEAGAVGYANTKRLFEYAYGALLSVAPLAGLELPFDPAMLPTVESITRYVSFGLSGLVSDERGLEALTDSDGYGPTSVAMYLLCVAAVWAPLEEWSRSLDDWPCCGGALRQIYERLETARQSNQGYPERLAELVRDEQEWRLDYCPAASELFGGEETEAYATFTYVLDGRSTPPPLRFPDDWMIVWDSKPRHNGGRLVLLGSGGVIWLTEESFTRRLQEQNR